MNLLAGKIYDPAAAVTKATSALLAMTALDTANLRLTFTVPPSGIVRVRLFGVLHGATTFPSILLGVLEGSTVKGRVAPCQSLGNTAVATALVSVEADFIVSGLTPGQSLNWDAAYAVETIVAATGIKYGGPNNTTANDAFGGFGFEIWDPCPDYLPSAVPTSSLDAKVQAIDDFVDTEVGAIKTKTDSLTFTTAGKVDATFNAAGDFPQACADKAWSTAARALTDKADFALSAAEHAALVNELWNELTSEGRTAGSFGQLLKDRIDAAISSRSSHTAADVRTEMDANSVDLDVIIGYVDELETRLSAVRAALLDNLVNLDAAVSSRAAPGAAMALTPGERTASADAVLDRDMAAGADTGTNAVRTVRQALRALRNKVDAALGRVYKEDDVTPSWGFTTTSAAGDPIVAIDPDNA